jgi:hypothetical protein
MPCWCLTQTEHIPCCTARQLRQAQHWPVAYEVQLSYLQAKTCNWRHSEPYEYSCSINCMASCTSHVPQPVLHRQEYCAETLAVPLRHDHSQHLTLATHQTSSSHALASLPVPLPVSLLTLHTAVPAPAAGACLAGSCCFAQSFHVVTARVVADHRQRRCSCQLPT